MICVTMIKIGESLVGFDVKGHSNHAKAGEDIVCASVSSVCYMIANTITEVLGIDASIKVEDGYMQMVVPTNDAVKARDILKGLELHLKEIAKDYPNNIKLM